MSDKRPSGATTCSSGTPAIPRYSSESGLQFRGELAAGGLPADYTSARLVKTGQFGQRRSHSQPPEFRSQTPQIPKISCWLPG
jgi:hypothetical protein